MVAKAVWSCGMNMGSMMLKRLPLNVQPGVRKKKCSCGEVLKGLKLPYECPLREGMYPAKPVGHAWFH